MEEEFIVQLAKELISNYNAEDPFYLRRRNLDDGVIYQSAVRYLSAQGKSIDEIDRICWEMGVPTLDNRDEESESDDEYYDDGDNWLNTDNILRIVLDDLGYDYFYTEVEPFGQGGDSDGYDIIIYRDDEKYYTKLGIDPDQFDILKI